MVEESAKKTVDVEVRATYGADFDKCYIHEEEIQPTIVEYVNAGFELVFRPWCWRVTKTRVSAIEAMYKKIVEERK